MKVIKKMFGGLELTWPKLIICALVAGIYTAVMAIISAAEYTSFADISISFECWVLFGILIIVNSRSEIDSALKCFVFFLISQPLVYLIQVPFSDMGWGLFGYYKYWFIWTILTLPMGYIGYKMKKDKWWGVLILAPMLLLLAFHASGFLKQTIFWFPHHLLSLLICVFTMFASVLGIFENKKAKTIGLALCGVFLAAAVALALVQPLRYEPVIFTNGGSAGVTVDDTYEAALEGDDIGTVAIEWMPELDDWALKGHFDHAGKARLTLTAPDGSEKQWDISVYPDYVDYEPVG